MTTVEVAPLMELGRRIAHRLAAAWGVLYFEDELCGIALSALPQALSEHDGTTDSIKPFAAEQMANAVRRAIKKQRKLAGREVPAEDAGRPTDRHPGVQTDELAGDAVDALLSVYTGEELRSNGDAKLLTREAWTCLHREIALLDPADRRLVELRYFEEMRWEEVAKELEMTERNAQKHDARIREILRDRLIAWYRVRPLRRGS